MVRPGHTGAGVIRNGTPISAWIVLPLLMMIPGYRLCGGISDFRGAVLFAGKMPYIKEMAISICRTADF